MLFRSEHIDSVTGEVYYSCEENVCICNNGTAQANAQCDENTANECSECNQYYHMVTDRPDEKDDPNWSADCAVNQCVCQYGTPVDDGFCNDHQGNQCKVCDDGFTLTDDEQCIPNECTCENGTARNSTVTDDVCLVVARNECQVCDQYYKISTTNATVVTITVAESTYAVFDTPSCIRKVCDCDNGIPVIDCDVEGVQDCDICDDYYHYTQG